MQAHTGITEVITTTETRGVSGVILRSSSLVCTCGCCGCIYPLDGRGGSSAGGSRMGFGLQGPSPAGRAAEFGPFCTLSCVSCTGAVCNTIRPERRQLIPQQSKYNSNGREGIEHETHQVQRYPRRRYQPQTMGFVRCHVRKTKSHVTLKTVTTCGI